MHFYHRRKQQNTSDSSGTNGSNDGDSYVSDGEIEGGELAVQQAWAELAEIEKEQERWHDERQRVEEDLELCRQHGVALEDVSCFSFLYTNNQIINFLIFRNYLHVLVRTMNVSCWHYFVVFMNWKLINWHCKVNELLECMN